MSDLLAIGKSGVLAFNTALATIGENVSNASSTGYTRRTVAIKEDGVTASGRTFSGSSVEAIGRAGDDYQVTLARNTASDASVASAKLSWLSTAESAMNDDATGVGQSATAIFTAGSSLAADPDGSGGRTAFLEAIDQTASAFRTTAGALSDAATGIAAAATTTVNQVNAALDGLAKINAQLRITPAGTAGQADLLDQRDQALTTIANGIGIDVTLAADGSATVRAGVGGPTLVSGTGAGHLALKTASDGTLSLTVSGAAGSNAVTMAGGTLGGLSDSASLVAERRTELDTLANSFATQLNAWNAAGTTAAGAAGGALVSGTGAATLQVATSDPAAIAAAKGGAANGNLLALSDLRGTTGVEAQWSAAVTDQGQLVASAQTASTAATARSTAAQTSLSAASGVDLDTEAADLVRYQQAYSGAAKVIQVAKETMQSILDII